MDMVTDFVSENDFDFVRTEVLQQIVAKDHPASATEAGEHRDESREKLIAGLTRLFASMDADGPYFSGDEINAVDIALMPFAYRIDVLLGTCRDFKLPDEGETWQRYQRWYVAMLEHPAFGKTAFDQGDYEKRLVEHYHPYSQAGGSTHVTRTN